MAVDWIKMRTDLYRDPKVCIMADLLMADHGKLASYVNQICQVEMAVTRNVMRNVTVGALVTVWGVTRHRGKRDGDDLVIPKAGIGVIDDIADLPGFGDAMNAVGWVMITSQGLRFPKFFEEFNVDPETDAKQKNAERQRRYREKSNALRDVTVTSQSNAREEERRVSALHCTAPKQEQKKTKTTKRWQGDDDLATLAKDTATPLPLGKVNGSSVFDGVTAEWLRNPTTMIGWFRRQLGAASPVLPGNRAEAVFVLCCASRSTDRGIKNPVGMFTTLVTTHDWESVKRFKEIGIKQLKEAIENGNL